MKNQRKMTLNSNISMITIEIKSSYLADCPNHLYRQTIRRVLKSKLLNQSYQIDGTNLKAMMRYMT